MFHNSVVRENDNATPNSPSPESKPQDKRSRGNRQFAFSAAVQTLKRFSGRLSRLIHFKSQNAEHVHRMLIVEDERAICFSMMEYFTHHGFQVDTATEVEDAERLLSDSSYEVMIQDLKLSSDKNSVGLEVIRFAHEHSPDTKIVVLTAYGTKEIESEALGSGAVAFLRKPQRLSQLAQVVSGLIESQGSFGVVKTLKGAAALSDGKGP